MSDDAGPPPLEDMTEAVLAARKRKQNLQPFTKPIAAAASVASPATVGTKAKANVNSKAKAKGKAKAKSKKKSQTQMFGGLAGGFFGKGGGRTRRAKRAGTDQKEAPKTKPAQDMPFIKPNARQHDPLVLEEVQKALKPPPGTGPGGMSTKFLSALAKSPSMQAALRNPRLMTVMNEISQSKDTASVASRYADDPEVVAFIKEYLKLLAQQQDLHTSSGGRGSKGQQSHAPQAGKDQATQGTTKGIGPRNVPPEKLAEWMATPHIRRVLDHPFTGRMLAEIQKDVNAFAKFVNTPALRVLVAEGIVPVPPQFAHLV